MICDLTEIYGNKMDREYNATLSMFICVLNSITPYLLEMQAIRCESERAMTTSTIYNHNNVYGHKIEEKNSAYESRHTCWSDTEVQSMNHVQRGDGEGNTSTSRCT